MYKIDLDNKLKREYESYKMFVENDYKKSSLRKLVDMYNKEDYLVSVHHSPDSIYLNYIIPYVRSNKISNKKRNEFFINTGLNSLNESVRRGKEIIKSIVKSKGNLNDELIVSLSEQYALEDGYAFEKYSMSKLKEYIYIYLAAPDDMELVNNYYWVSNLRPSVKNIKYQDILEIINTNDSELSNVLDKYNINKTKMIALRNAYFHAFPKDLKNGRRLNDIVDNGFKVQNKDNNKIIKDKVVRIDDKNKIFNKLINYCNMFSNAYIYINQYVDLVIKLSDAKSDLEKEKIINKINNIFELLNVRLNSNSLSVKRIRFDFNLDNNLKQYNTFHDRKLLLNDCLFKTRRKLLDRYNFSNASLNDAIDEAKLSSNWSLIDQITYYESIINEVDVFYTKVVDDVFDGIKKCMDEKHSFNSYDYYLINNKNVGIDIIKAIDAKSFVKDENGKKRPRHAASLKEKFYNFANDMDSSIRYKSVDDLLKSVSFGKSDEKALTNIQKKAIAEYLNERGIELTAKNFYDFARAYINSKYELVDEHGKSYR